LSILDPRCVEKSAEKLIGCMDSNASEVKQIAAQILAAMLANPHIYPNISDDSVHGQREQTLIILAVEMAETLVEKVESRR
jgi:hypothetical protein